jgi:hypothetical protein
MGQRSEAESRDIGVNSVPDSIKSNARCCVAAPKSTQLAIESMADSVKMMHFAWKTLAVLLLAVMSVGALLREHRNASYAGGPSGLSTFTISRLFLLYSS